MTTDLSSQMTKELVSLTGDIKELTDEVNTLEKQLNIAEFEFEHFSKEKSGEIEQMIDELKKEGGEYEADE